MLRIRQIAANAGMSYVAYSRLRYAIRCTPWAKSQCKGQPLTFNYLEAGYGILYRQLPNNCRDRFVIFVDKLSSFNYHSFKIAGLAQSKQTNERKRKDNQWPAGLTYPDHSAAERRARRSCR